MRALTITLRFSENVREANERQTTLLAGNLIYSVRDNTPGCYPSQWFSKKRSRCVSAVRLPGLHVRYFTDLVEGTNAIEIDRWRVPGGHFTRLFVTSGTLTGSIVCLGTSLESSLLAGGK